jgi:hypothetical protein
MTTVTRNCKGKNTFILGILPLTFVLSGCFAPVLAADYYVDIKGSDQGQGTQASPWRTVNKALASVPPDQGNTIRVGRGTFDLGGKVSVPSGVNLVGAGIDATTIKGEIWLIGVRNLSISGITFNGKNYAYELGMYIRDGSRLLIHDLVFNAYTKKAIDIERVSNGQIYNITITDSSYNKRIPGGGGKQSHAIDLGNLTNFDFHNLNIDTRKRGGQGIGTVSDAWPKNRPSAGKAGVLRNVRFYNLDIKVDQWNAWANGWTPQMALELWHHNCYNCKIYNSNFNSTVSLSSPPNIKSTSIQVHNNLWYGPNNPFYACEVASDNIEFDHNYIRGGYYPIAMFGNKYKNLNVHHNIFENTKSPALLVNFHNKVENFKFINNTVYIANYKDPLFFFAKGEAANQQIRNNIFYNSVGKVNNLFGASVGLDNNLFFNVKPMGSGAMLFNPQLTLSGNLPSPYYMPKSGSRVINIGAIQTLDPMWNIGKKTSLHFQAR